MKDHTTEDLLETGSSEMTAAQFLEEFQPGGPWPLTTIGHDKRPETVFTRSAQDVTRFVETWSGRANIYFTPATARDTSRAPASGKFGKKDIAGSHWQWVDLDPPSDADPIMWHTETITALFDPDLTPTIIVSSGRGVWAFWKRPHYSADPEEIEGVNRALAQKFRGDDCHNIDRLARLPGTVNLKTRQPAAVLAWNPTSAFVLPAPMSKAGSSEDAWTDEPDEGWDGETDDKVLIETARNSRGGARAVFGDGATFKQLWQADGDALAEAFPSYNVDKPYDGSQADMALASHLMRLTGNNCERTKRLMFESELVRPKWDRDDYLHRTILKCRHEPAEERRARQIAENVQIGDDEEDLPVPTVMTVDDMRRDLVYIGGQGAVAHRVTGRVRKREAAAGEYAASKYKWTDDNDKPKSCPALKLWLESKDRTSVDVMAWVPGAKQICSPPEVANGDTRAFNTWRGLRPLPAPENWPEWVKAFDQHLTYLVPIEPERRRFLQWLAHIVQRPEVLPHTSYLMVTEQTGIGRNWLASVMSRVLRGYVAAGISLAPILDGKFNGRLSQKLLAVVDETREGMSERRYVRGEALKSLITEEHRHIDMKYGLQTVEKNCCRWLMFSNHYDALPFDNNDRRVIVIQNPTERADPAYYERIYGLVDNPDFIGSVRKYFETLDLTDFKPGAHAPMNAAKELALDAQASEVDKAVKAFREVWPGPLATTKQIHQFIHEFTGGAEHNINGRHLTSAIKRAGMQSADRSIKMNRRAQRIVIVRELTVDQVKSTPPNVLGEIIAKADEDYRA